MTAAKHLILTFDYELFLGSRSGTAENCILKPTEKLIEIFNKYSLSNCVFFVDTAYLIRLKGNPALACQEDFKKIKEQLILLHKQGHYIYPHLHPHWLDAIYLPEINQWDLSNVSKYSFSSITEEERDILFSDSIKLLEDICGPRQELGYRAGGWCIQPFSDFKHYFKKYNILYDFSVMQGYYCNDKIQNFDFRKAPSKAFYKFESETTVEDPKGSLTEVAISTLKVGYLNRLSNKFFTKLLFRRGMGNFGDGYSAHSASLKEIKPDSNKMASLELLSIVNINDYLKAFDQKNSLQFISHPKMLSPHNLISFDALLRIITSKYKINTDFKIMLNPALANSIVKEDKLTDILLISYVFPPYPGIGGRRWAKFAKYLATKNYRIHVICSSNPFKENSIWTKDIINNKNIIIHRLDPKYPSIMLKRPGNFTERLSYKIWDLILPVFTKGNHYDRAIFWETDLLKKCSDIIENTGTKNIIISGAPFNCNYFATHIKKMFTNINLISDIRDPWTWVDTYGLALISGKKRKFEEFKEAEVIALSDTVLVPADVMKQHLQNKYPLHSSKIKKLPHGYDSFEIPEKIPVIKNKNTRLLFYGNIYEGIGHYFREIAIAIKESNNTLFLDFYSDTEKYREIFEEEGVLNNINYFKPVPEKILFEKMSEYTGVLIVYPDYAINFISTKFYEIIYTKTPIFYIGNKGKTSEFIIENKLGYYIKPESISMQLTSIYKNEYVLDYNLEFDVSPFSFENLTLEFINYLK